MNMVHVGDVRVRVFQLFVAVMMCMGFSRRISRIMRVLVMRVMHMRVGMLHYFVLMFMFVMLGQMQPHTTSHQRACDGDLPGQRIMKADDCNDCSQEGCR